MSYSTNILLTASLILFSACSTKEATKSQGGYYYKDIYFGMKPSNLQKKGIRDGCKTAQGFYKKSHTLFKNNKAYNIGWFLGRNKCKILLKIDGNGELVH